MRCEEVEHLIAEYVAGSLPAEGGLSEHLAECAGCRNEARALRNIWSELENVPVPTRRATMQPDLTAALAAIKPETQPYPIWRKIMPYALAASLMMAFSLTGAFFTSRVIQQSPDQRPSIRSLADAATTHYRGAATPSVTLVEYGDYECPPCASFNTVLKEVLRRYGNTVRLEYHHFPLSIHPNAALAARAAEAAGEQGRYWEMNDLLFDLQRKWAHTANAEQTFVAFAGQLGLDTAQFTRAMHSPAIQQRILNDTERAKEEGDFVGTPTFFLNGRRLEVPQVSADEFAKRIDAAINGNTGGH